MLDEQIRLSFEEQFGIPLDDRIFEGWVVFQSFKVKKAHVESHLWLRLSERLTNAVRDVARPVNCSCEKISGYFPSGLPHAVNRGGNEQIHPLFHMLFVYQV
jgi:hypothetical protein